MKRPWLAYVLLCLLTACACPQPQPHATAGSATAETAAPPEVTLTVVGTNDLHGHLEWLPLLGGYLKNLRQARRPDGAVLLVDGGDMFQGTLESNLSEGAAVVEAYGVLGYAAVAVGNHELDFGPVGPQATVKGAGDHPRGALRARAAEAKFPFLSANMVEQATGQPLGADGIRATATVEMAGIRVGLIGVSGAETLATTMAANVKDLAMAPLVATIEALATKLRAEGATVIVVAAHAGGECERPDDPSSCRGEVVEIAQALPAGLVDVIIAAHTHKAMAQRINGVAVIESYAYGRAFGRVDLAVDRATGRVSRLTIHGPRDLCSEPKAPVASCQPGSYEGAPVQPDAAVAQAVRPYAERARAARERPLGVRLAAPLSGSYSAESPLGNLLADAMRAVRPGTDVALINGGGIRADLPAGPLTYGALYETFPFDNRFARATVTASGLKRLLAHSLQSDGGFLSVSGVLVQARCSGGALEVSLRRSGEAKPLPDEAKLTLLASDYLATSGALQAAGLTPEDFSLEDDPPIRDAIAQYFQERGGGELPADDPSRYDPARPRVAYPGSRPVRCDK